MRSTRLAVGDEPRRTRGERFRAVRSRESPRTGRRTLRGAVGAGLILSVATSLGAQPALDTTVVTVAGSGPRTYVLVSGIVGGVAGFHRLQTRLLKRGHRVAVIDPYRLSLDSADVTFTALARRVDRVLGAHGIDSAIVVGHAHGAGVALRLAANAPHRVAALCFLDVGALASNRTKVFSSSLRLVPIIVRIPGGRRFVRGRFVNGLRENSGRDDWLDAATQRSYAEPLLDNLGDAIRMAGRLSRAREPDSVAEVVARVSVPVTVILGEAPHPSAPDSAELGVLEPLGGRLRIVRLPAVGHFPHEEAPDEVARFLEAPPSASTFPGRTESQASRPPAASRRS